MAQHFLLSARARTLSLGKVLRMTDKQAETMFASLRWADTDGKAVCAHCGCPTVYEARRPSGALRFRSGLRAFARAALRRRAHAHRRGGARAGAGGAAIGRAPVRSRRQQFLYLPQ